MSRTLGAQLSAAPAAKASRWKLAAGDADAVAAVFEADGRAREPDGADLLEHNALRPGVFSPRAGFTVFVSGAGGKLAAARIYEEL